MLPPFSGVATSQSTATNVQVQLGDVFSTQTLNVVDVSDATSATTTATGNAVTGAVETGSLSAQSTQTFAGTASALTHLICDDQFRRPDLDQHRGHRQRR